MAVGASPSAPIVANIAPAPPAAPTAVRNSRREIMCHPDREAVTPTPRSGPGQLSCRLVQPIVQGREPVGERGEVLAAHAVHEQLADQGGVPGGGLAQLAPPG